jgi:hypothetical protein
VKQWVIINSRKIGIWLGNNVGLLTACASIVAIITLPLIIVGGLLNYLQLRDFLSPVNVELVFANPNMPLFYVFNPSTKVVQQPKYQFLIYDLSVPSTPGNPEEPFLNLEIPVAVLDFIRPGEYEGPWTIQSVAHWGNKIEKGHYLFGFAEVLCPICERVHYYWFFAHVGDAGWFVKISEDESKDIYKNLSAVLYSGGDYLNRIDKLLPIDRRIRIGK